MFWNYQQIFDTCSKYNKYVADKMWNGNDNDVRRCAYIVLKWYTQTQEIRLNIKPFVCVTDL